MIAMSPSLLLATANAFALEGEAENPRRFDGADDARKASALFVNHVGYHSHRSEARRSVWPFALTASCDDMAEEACQRGVMHGALPEPGQLFLKRSLRSERFIGVGIVIKAWSRSRTEPRQGFRLRVCIGSAQLVETNTPHRHSTVRWAIIETMDAVPRNGDRFIDWIELDARDPSRIGRSLRHWLLPFRSTVTPWRNRKHKAA